MRVLRPANLDQFRQYNLHNRHTHWVLTEGSQVFHTSRFTDSTFEPALQQALGR